MKVKMAEEGKEGSGCSLSLQYVLRRRRFKKMKRATKSVRGGNGVAWTRKDRLGKGKFGFISLARPRAPATIDHGPRAFAVKSAEVGDCATLRSEKNILLDLKECPNVIDCYGEEITSSSFDGKNYYNILIEYCGGGSLAERMKKANSSCGSSKLDVVSINRDMVRGLAEIHGRGYVHCDIKPSNILLADAGDGSGYTAKIADFGLSKKVATSGTAHEINGMKEDWRGTLCYLPPEALNEGVQDALGDIWALGCIVFEMICGFPLWDPEELSPDAIAWKIANAPQIPELPSHIPRAAKDFLERCLARSRDNRWPAHMLIHHPLCLLLSLPELDSKPAHSLPLW